MYVKIKCDTHRVLLALPLNVLTATATIIACLSLYVSTTTAAASIVPKLQLYQSSSVKQCDKHYNWTGTVSHRSSDGWLPQLQSKTLETYFCIFLENYKSYNVTVFCICFRLKLTFIAIFSNCFQVFFLEKNFHCFTVF